MSSRKTRHYSYAVLLVVTSILSSSAVTRNLALDYFPKIVAERENQKPEGHAITESSSNFDTTEAIAAYEQPMFATIIQNANEEVVCANDGSTLSKFFLCGTSDIRTLTLTQSGNSYEWQKLDENTCAPTVVDDCPTINTTCVWNTVGNNATYDLDAAGEYRVRIDSGQFYYFKVTQNPLDPQLVFENIICGNSGRVEVTNVPNGYEYSLNSQTGPFQDQPFFDIATAGDYTVYVRLKDVASSACLFPSNTVSVQALDIEVQASKTDILCSGEQGSVSVNVRGVPGFYTYRLIKNGITVDTFGPDGADSYTFANVGSGDYSVRVQTNKCDIAVTTDVNGDPITIGNGISPLDVSATASNSFGCGASSVAITVNTSGGTAPYRFSVDGGAFGASYTSTSTFSVSTSGTYAILVEDANGCQHNASVDVADIPPPIFNLTAQDASCGGSNTGQVMVNVTNGYGYGLEYSINNGISYQVSNVFSGLAPGNYDVMLRYTQDSFSCTTLPQSTTVGTPSTITATAVADSQPSCLNENGGQISISGTSGGTAPYEFSIGAGFSSTSTFTNLGVGSYSPQIRDANGCVLTLPPIVFNTLDRPNDLTFSISSLDCITTTASVTLAETGGTAPYAYEIIAPASAVVNNGNNNTFTGLGLGSYTFRVTDSEGCSYEENYAITNISSIRVQSQQLSPITCFGDSDGEGRFIVDSFNSTYSYSIDGGTTHTGQTNNEIPITNLTAGNYTILVTDEETNCTDSATLMIEGPSATFALDNLTVEAMSCQNGNTGSVVVNTSGGWGGNSYSLTQPDNTVRGPQNGQTFSNLTQNGTYTVTVTDLNGCSVTDTFSLSALSTPVLTVDSVASDFCYDAFDAASIVVNTSLGVAPYEYRINSGTFANTNSFTGLTPGTYTIEVADANDCRDTISLTIAPQINASATIIQELECSGPDGAIQVSIADGYPAGSSYVSYEVSINGGAYSTANNPIAGNSFVYTIPNDGSITTSTSFRFLVSDSQGCTNESNEVIINPQETISGTTTPTDTQCGDMTSGVVTLTPDTSSGIPPYEFSNDGGATFSSQNVFSGYAPGTYNDFMIRDSRGCMSPLLSATIATSVPLDANATANPALCSAGVVEGSIDSNINNGTAPFTYTLLDVGGNVVATIGPIISTTVNFSNLPQGDYTVVTTDSLGCEDRDTVTITEDNVTITPVPDPISDCTSGLTNTITINGGVGPFLLRLVGETIPRYSPNSPPRTHTFTGLDFGTTYLVEVEDTGTGCIYVEEIPPYDGPSPLDVSLVGTSVSCDALGSGSLSYTLTGYAGANVTIEVTNLDTGASVYGPTSVVAAGPYSDISGLAPGNYLITADDPANGCTDSDIAVITLNEPSIIIESNIPATCTTGALVTVRGAGGTAPYTFAYVPTGGTPTAFSNTTTFNITGPYPSDYDFYLEDAHGCQTMTTVTVTEDAGVPNPTIDVINQCTATSGYQINVTSPLSAGSGLPEVTFQYDIGGGYQDSPNFVVPNPGSYTITVRDGNGCTNTVVADVFDFFAITAQATSTPTCNAGDGVITVTTTGGSGNFEYQLRDNTTLLPIGSPQSGNTFNNIAPGDYNILVTDLSSNTAPLCSDEAEVNVSTVTSPIISATPSTPISCFGADDASISVELQTGTGTDTPLEYYLYDGSSSTVITGPQSSSIFSDLGPGTYQVGVVSYRGCVDRSNDITINEPTSLELHTVNTEFVCIPSNNQYSTATITAYTDTNGDGSGASTGTGPYTFSMNDGTPAFDGTNFQTSNVFTVIDNGTNQTIVITARDQSGCEMTSTVNINAPTDLTFSFNINPISCDTSGLGVNPGSIAIIIDQGVGNYEVELLPLGSEPARNSGGTNTVNWPISTPGDYIFSVTDLSGGGCSYLTPIVHVPEYNTIQATIAETRPVSCFNSSDGEISLEIAQYSGAYQYEVFSKDNSGVETTTGISGSFDTNSPINTPELISGLPAGNMVVHIEALDAPFCDVLSNVATIRSPDRPLTATLTQTSDVTCNIPGQGEITVVGDGGWGGYEYQLIAPDGSVLVDFPNTDPIFKDLSEGNHTVNIRDANGCIFTETITLNLPIPIYADIQVVSPLRCHNDNDAIIEAYNLSGGQGTGNYLFQLQRLSDASTSGLQTTPTFNNLSSGDYSIIIYDGWNCSYTTVPITVQDPEIIIAELVELQPPGCGDVGRMELTVTNPEPGVDYFYRRSGTTDAFQAFGTGMATVALTADITLDPGPFQYDVQNSNGCPFERSNQISLDPAAPLVIDLDLTNATINCAGESTGIIRSEAFGGIGNYTYSLLDSNSPPYPTATHTVRPEQESGIFRNLDHGTYYVYARSGGCEAISPPIVIDPKPPLVLEYLETQSPTCYGAQNGQIIIEASGGTGRIRYSISDTLSEFFEGDDEENQNRKTFDGLPPRQYDIIVQDDLGCTITRTVIIEEPMELVASLANATPETCLGDNDGSIQLKVVGGTPPYYTSINSAAEDDFEENSNLFFDDLEGGETYVFFIKDSAGCLTNVTVPVGLGIDIVAQPEIQYGCEGIFPYNTIRVDLSEDGNLSEVLFSLDTDDISIASRERTFGDLEPGEHMIYVYHENGCVTTTSFKIEAYEPLMLEAGQVGPDEITVVATGGFGDYEYYFQGENYGSNNVFSTLTDQDIHIMVRDRMGCEANLVMPFEFNEVPEVPDYFTPNGDLRNEYWGVENREFFPNIEVKIYDRYGRVVAVLDKVSGWDGTYEGAPLPTGDYWYVVNANDKKNQQWVGHFTLYR